MTPPLRKYSSALAMARATSVRIASRPMAMRLALGSLLAAGGALAQAKTPEAIAESAPPPSLQAQDNGDTASPNADLTPLA